MTMNLLLLLPKMSKSHLVSIITLLSKEYHGLYGDRDATLREAVSLLVVVSAGHVFLPLTLTRAAYVSIQLQAAMHTSGALPGGALGRSRSKGVECSPPVAHTCARAAMAAA